MQRLAVIDVSRLLNHFYMTKYDNKRNKYYFSSFSLLINNAEENHKFIFYLVKNYHYGNEFNRSDIKK